MNNHLFNVNNEERQNILDKHRTLYDGYSVRSNTPNEQPLYVQDMANDKGGVTIKSNGDVSTYNNKIYMRESKEVCPECGLTEDMCECDYKQVKGIGGEHDFDYTENKCEECDEQTDEDAEFISSEDLDEEPEYLTDDSLDEEFKGKLSESLKMFKRMSNFN